MTHKSYSSGFGSVPNSTPKDNDPMVRIADALEEVLRLVKQDQEDAKKRMLAAADEGLKEHEETHE